MNNNASERLTIDPKLRLLFLVPDGSPAEATPLQGFAMSLCSRSGLLRLVQQLPSDVFEYTPEMASVRVARRIASQAPVTWFGQSRSALTHSPFPRQAAFTIIFLARGETGADYSDWVKCSPGIPSLVAEVGGDISYADLSFEAVQARFISVCEQMIKAGDVGGAEAAAAAIKRWQVPSGRALGYEVGGHGSIAPNAAVLTNLGFDGVGRDPYKLHHLGETAHLEQILRTTNSVLDEREANPLSVANLIFPRSPDLNLFCPSTYDFASAFRLNPQADRGTRREVKSVLSLLERQTSYGFEISSETQVRAAIGVTTEELAEGKRGSPHPLMTLRQMEVWLSTEAVGCLAVSEISGVVRLPNRLNRTRGVVRQFAQHYRADRPQVEKRTELFRGVQRAIESGLPSELLPLIDRSKDGIRIIADAHLEWLDVRGIPLALRYNVSRIPVTPGNLFIDTLSAKEQLQTSPEDYTDILVVSGLDQDDILAKQFDLAFHEFGKEWRENLNITSVRVTSRQGLVDAINNFEGNVMIFDGHGSHKPDDAGQLWLGEESVNIWTLRGELQRVPPIVILSACDTHAADRNHATVANGFLALGCRSVLGSVFPLHASQAAIFVARLLYRISAFVPAFVGVTKRSITWLEVVSGMLRRQLVTDILFHLKSMDLVPDEDVLDLLQRLSGIAEEQTDDPMERVRQALLGYGIEEARLDAEIHRAVSSSSTISYVHLGRPETILINTIENVNAVHQAASGIK